MTCYSFDEKTRLFPSPEGMPGPGPYYTCLVSMADLESFPFDYALYFSTDHDPGEGGIWLYVCSGDPLEPSHWLSYEAAVAAGHFDHIVDKPASNPIHLDNLQGTGHTETPHARVVDGKVHMTYHKNGIEGTQRTILATSEDGIRFERLRGDADSVVLSYDPATDAGNGHTGYFRWSVNPFPGIAHRFVGYSLHGGGDNYYSAIWGSDDAISWERLDILTPLEGLAVDDDEMILIWHEIDPDSIRPLGNGEFVAIAGVGNRASGGVARITELYEIFLAGDGRTLTRRSRKILPVGAPGAQDAEELSSPTSVVIDGVTHLVYVGASAGGTVNTILGARGVLDSSALPDPLSEAERRRHIHISRPKMKTAIIHGPGDLRVEEVKQPEIGPADVLVRVRASGICGSDVHRYRGTDYGRAFFPYPMNSGHEYCGEVVEVGRRVQTFREGDRVTLGVSWTSGDLGAFSEYVHVRDADLRLHRLPGEMEYVDGALIETLIVALKSYRRPNPKADDRILILGAGPIGLSILLYCRAMGLEDITVSEPSAVRRKLAARIGAATVNPAEADLAEVIAASSGGRGIDVTFECAGQEATLKQALALTRPEGRISLIGHYSKTPHFNIEELIVKGLNVFAPIGGNPFFDEAVELVVAKKVDLPQLVSHQYPIEKAQEAFETAADVDRSVKVIFIS